MKNFEMRYPLDGTSALQPEFGHAPAVGAIIEFPGSVSQGACASSARAQRPSSAAHRAHGHYGASETVRALHRGSAAGCAYGRVRPWQGALAGCVFSLFAFVSIFIGL